MPMFSSNVFDAMLYSMVRRDRGTGSLLTNLAGATVAALVVGSVTAKRCNWSGLSATRQTGHALPSLRSNHDLIHDW